MDTVGVLLRAGAEGRNVGAIADEFDRVEVPAAMAYALGLDPDQDAAGEGAALPDGRLVVLAGPGVVGTRSIDGLRAFAAAANVPVANTWGAKGVLLWDSPFHMGTCGLQARDFELLDFASYDAIVATGTDLAESPEERFARAPFVDIPPPALGWGGLPENSPQVLASNFGPTTSTGSVFTTISMAWSLRPVSLPGQPASCMNRVQKSGPGSSLRSRASAT